MRALVWTELATDHSKHARLPLLRNTDHLLDTGLTSGAKFWSRKGELKSCSVISRRLELRLDRRDRLRIHAGVFKTVDVGFYKFLAFTWQ